MTNLKLLILLAVIIAGCETARINKTEYRISSATTELGSIGLSTSTFKFNNNFQTRSFPLLKNKVRVDITPLPFNKKIYTIYNQKAKQDQSAAKINYVDSLPIKPEFITISLLDTKGYINELNADYNKDIITYLKDTENASVITSLAIVLPKEALAKVKTAETFYLTNTTTDRKYMLTLYNGDKETERIDITLSTVVGYSIGEFCWATDNRQRWYIADIVKDNTSCSGETRSKIKEKKKKSIYKM
ncbi:hypothetical protein KJK34_07205 [Flavobacterium sp. D11R37]|uniref:hypothetical protein n=1 Tax=Flavobacterium coralii TaxID=2838017 RepID=UPI001CA6819D|nr:hypothetical protein [Flavobacterium coralii]MBY8962537.1 hypothetical protein [Flavobacterium coralii]